MAHDEVIWEALRRECALVAEHVGIGATAIGRADYERTAAYAQAFFALSVGFERGAKLVLSLDAALRGDGFLPSKTLRKRGHRLDRLLNEVVAVADRREIDGVAKPASEVHKAIIGTLTDFAANVNRYYNLEVLAAAEDADVGRDPIALWRENVTLRVLAAHDTVDRQQRSAALARAVAVPTDTYVSVIATTETGQSIRSVGELIIHSDEARFARRWERMYVLQIVRFLTNMIGEMGKRAQAAGLPVPFLYEYFHLFQQDDRYFRERKTWFVEGE